MENGARGLPVLGRESQLFLEILGRGVLGQVTGFWGADHPNKALEESSRALQRSRLTEGKWWRNRPALTDSRFRLVLNEFTAEYSSKEALSRREKHVAAPLFLEGLLPAGMFLGEDSRL